MESNDATLGKRLEKAYRDETCMTNDTVTIDGQTNIKNGSYKDKENPFSSINYISPTESPIIKGRQKIHRITLSSLPSAPRETIRENPQNPIDLIIREPTSLSINMFSAPTSVGSTSLANVHSLLKYLQPLENQRGQPDANQHPAQKADVKQNKEKPSQKKQLLCDRRTFDIEIKSKCKKLEQAYSFLDHYYRHSNRSDLSSMANKSGLQPRVLESWIRDKTSMLRLLAQVLENDPNFCNLL